MLCEFTPKQVDDYVIETPITCSLIFLGIEKQYCDQNYRHKRKNLKKTYCQYEY